MGWGIGKYINEQNDLIDKARKEKKECCLMIDVKPSVRKQLEYYYTNMIGYKIQDGCIYFNHINYSLRSDEKIWL